MSGLVGNRTAILASVSHVRPPFAGSMRLQEKPIKYVSLIDNNESANVKPRTHSAMPVVVSPCGSLVIMGSFTMSTPVSNILKSQLCNAG